MRPHLEMRQILSIRVQVFSCLLVASSCFVIVFCGQVNVMKVIWALLRPQYFSLVSPLNSFLCASFSLVRVCIGLASAI